MTVLTTAPDQAAGPAQTDHPTTEEPDRTGRPARDVPSEPRGRGRLTIGAKVLEKVAGQAAAETAASQGRSGGFLGVGAEVDPSARPRVDVDLVAEYADLTIKVGIGYPGSIRAAAQDIREHVTTRVHELTGVRVRRVDIDITFVTLEARPDRQALR